MRKTVVVDTPSKNEEIFAHAVRVFKDKGYHAASMQDIADAVGLQKGSLYHYISSKDELLFKIFERGTGALSKQLETIIASDDSPTNKLHRAIEAHLTALCDQLDIYTVYLSERRTFGGKLNGKVRAEGERHARLLEKLIEQGIKSGDFRQVDIKMSAHAILGMCNWLYQWYSPEGRLKPHEIAVIFSDLMVDGLTNSPLKSRKARK